MKTTLNRNDLLKVLGENRAKHDAEHKAAKEAYGKKLIEKIEQELVRVKGGKKFRHISLVEPRVHLDEYDRAIKMVEMTTDERIDLTPDDFSKFVMDEWNWKRDFAMLNATYSGQGDDVSDEE
jgi:hypothetical protein